jgi:hypothetical protein
MTRRLCGNWQLPAKYFWLHDVVWGMRGNSMRRELVEIRSGQGYPVRYSYWMVLLLPQKIQVPVGNARINGGNDFHEWRFWLLEYINRGSRRRDQLICLSA